MVNSFTYQQLKTKTINSPHFTAACAKPLKRFVVVSLNLLTYDLPARRNPYHAGGNRGLDAKT